MTQESMSQPEKKSNIEIRHDFSEQNGRIEVLTSDISIWKLRPGRCLPTDGAFSFKFLREQATSHSCAIVSIPKTWCVVDLQTGFSLTEWECSERYEDYSPTKPAARFGFQQTIWLGWCQVQEEPAFEHHY